MAYNKLNTLTHVAALAQMVGQLDATRANMGT